MCAVVFIKSLLRLMTEENKCRVNQATASVAVFNVFSCFLCFSLYLLCNKIAENVVAAVFGHRVNFLRKVKQ